MLVLLLTIFVSLRRERRDERGDEARTGTDVILCMKRYKMSVFYRTSFPLGQEVSEMKWKGQSKAVVI